MPYPIRPIFEGLTPLPETAQQAARSLASYDANRASRAATDAAFSAGASIEEANRASAAAYAAVMDVLPCMNEIGATRCRREGRFLMARNAGGSRMTVATFATVGQAAYVAALLVPLARAEG